MSGGGKGVGLGVRINGQLLDFGAVVSAVIYFIVFMAVVYFVIVVPYRAYAAHRGFSVFGGPSPVKTCPECLSEDLPVGATRCRHCGTSLSGATA